MPLERSIKTDRESIDLAKGIIYGAGLSNKQTLRVVSSLRALSPFTELACNYAESFSVAAMELGLQIPQYPNSSISELHTLIENRLTTFDFPPNKVVGIKRGLSHGFYSTLTLPQIIESSIKADFCHESCLLIESNYRTLMFKGRVLEEEKKRVSKVLVSGMADMVGIIRGDGFTDQFYREIVKTWQPDVYFVNSGSGSVAIKEAECRAKMVGAELVITPDISGRHTTDFINSIRSRS